MSMKSKSIILGAIAASVVMTGCATKPPAEVGEQIKPDAEVLAKIAESATRASKSMERLAAIRSTTSGLKIADRVAPEGLDVPITINWAGPIDGLAKKLAELTGYKYEGTEGSVPSMPILVSVAVTETSAFQILANAGAQAGSAADIVIRPSTKSIMIKYAPATQSGGYANPSEK